ncbi:hypothetical protein ACRAD_03190 [Acinetobacter radioresistens DSM 6976 = NBRC 102413 = CIP 103788]|jgi:hypothetical protein|nr:hypothetical protein ACRAD_03190 [Acinetobacter radioresistens DSM 6976 = NBRC 102413 = CIP 103788]
MTLTLIPTTTANVSIRDLLIAVWETRKKSGPGVIRAQKWIKISVPSAINIMYLPVTCMSLEQEYAVS